MATIDYERKVLTDEWEVCDVQKNRPDLTDEQAFKVLCLLSKAYDANDGINWNIIDCAADHLFPEESQTC